MDLKEKYRMGKISLYKIRNRNELRVIKLIPEILKRYKKFKPDIIDIQDIYALTLNNLPARYAQDGVIVLKEKVNNAEIQDAIREAIKIVRERPNY